MKRSQITTIVFSRNRACQLELLLRSLNFSVVVLYYYDPEFKAGYDKVIKMYPSVKFVLRYDFKKQLLGTINRGRKYTMFLVDDDVMIEPFYENCREFTEFKKDPDIICLSLKLTPNYCYARQPTLKNNKVEWKPYSRSSPTFNYRLRAWGCPMVVGGHIFRKKDILPMILATEELKNPNYLEIALNTNIPNRPLMLCFDKAKIINIIANQVQTDFPGHTFGTSVQELEKRFLEGERLSFQDIKEKATKARYIYIKEDYKFEKYK